MIVTSAPLSATDPTKCYSCARKMRDTEKRYGSERVCARCWDESLTDWEGEREERKRRHHERLELMYPVTSRVEARVNTSLRL